MLADLRSRFDRDLYRTGRALSRAAYRDVICRAKRALTMIPAPLQNLFDRLALAWHERAIALKAVSFAVVGVVNSVIDFGVFSFCYYYLGLPIVLANTVAWVVAVSGSYVMNSTITFAAESGRQLHLKGYLGFALSQIMGFFANTATVWCLVQLFSVPAWAAKVTAIAVSFVVNFSLSHFLVFRAPPRQNAD
jgi:putative flippase GtrA